MTVRSVCGCAALALVVSFSACKDATTTPAAQTTGPQASFASVADSGLGGGGSGNQSHFVANGTSASVNWFSNDSTGGGGFSYGNLSVTRGGPTNNPQTYLWYFVEQCSLYSCTFLGGNGPIPNADLSGGAQQLHLATNTTGNASFFTFGGSAGLITVDWKGNGGYQVRSSGTSEVSYPGFRQHSNGVSTYASAYAAGSVVGVSVPAGSFGSIGTNQSVTIDISH